MPFNNRRNSRDDKSGKARRSNPSAPNHKKGYRDDSGSPYGKRTSDGRSTFKPKSGKPFRDTPKWRDEDASGERSQGREKRSFSDERRQRDDRPHFGADKTKKFSGHRFKDDRPRFDSDNKGKPGGRKRRMDGLGSSNRINTQEPHHGGLIRLNRYIANAGICSRRKADELIEAGVISINGEIVSELGTKVDPAKDEVRYNGERLKREKLVYVLLNKPKDYITTTDDPQERRTVMHLVSKATNERIYPVGRLDRNTTGLLLMTNDGNLADKLAHPRNNISKIYQVELSKSLTQGDLNKIAFGLELEDGLVKPDDISYVQGASRREIGIQIHSGKNRIVRRIFEHLGYEVIKLDRVVYAHLTKKDLPRGRWRYLSDKEVIQLKHFTK